MNEIAVPIVILAGGIAHRLRPLTENIPKAMLDIHGEPFIAHQLRLLRSKGARRVVICAGYLGEMIQSFVKDGHAFNLEITFSFDGPKLLGTGGAIRQALPILGDSFLVLYGDSYLNCDYQLVQNAFQNSGKQALMTVFPNQGQWDTSNVEFRNGKIMAYSKKNQSPNMHHIDYGLGAFQSAAFSDVPRDVPFDLADLYAQLLSRGELAGKEIMERFYEVGSLRGLTEFRSLFENGIGS